MNALDAFFNAHPLLTLACGVAAIWSVMCAFLVLAILRNTAQGITFNDGSM